MPASRRFLAVHDGELVDVRVAHTPGKAQPMGLKQLCEKHFDFVITVCGDVDQTAPTFVHTDEHLYWPLVATRFEQHNS